MANAFVAEYNRGFSYAMEVACRALLDCKEWTFDEFSNTVIASLGATTVGLDKKGYVWISFEDYQTAFTLLPPSFRWKELK